MNPESQTGITVIDPEKSSQVLKVNVLQEKLDDTDLHLCAGKGACEVRWRPSSEKKQP